MSNPRLARYSASTVSDPARLVKALNDSQDALEAASGARVETIRVENVTSTSAPSIKPSFPIECLMVGRCQRTKGTTAITAAVFADWVMQTNGLVSVRFVGLPTNTTWSISVVVFETPDSSQSKLGRQISGLGGQDGG